jgi:hypothetical protein
MVVGGIDRALAQFADRAIDAPIISVSSAPADSSSPRHERLGRLGPNPVADPTRPAR